jgi:hypothetical protein
LAAVDEAQVQGFIPAPAITNTHQNHLVSSVYLFNGLSIGRTNLFCARFCNLFSGKAILLIIVFLLLVLDSSNLFTACLLNISCPQHPHNITIRRLLALNERWPDQHRLNDVIDIRVITQLHRGIGFRDT